MIVDLPFSFKCYSKQLSRSWPDNSSPRMDGKLIDIRVDKIGTNRNVACERIRFSGSRQPEICLRLQGDQNVSSISVFFLCKLILYEFGSPLPTTPFLNYPLTLCFFPISLMVFVSSSNVGRSVGFSSQHFSIISNLNHENNKMVHIWSFNCNLRNLVRGGKLILFNFILLLVLRMLPLQHDRDFKLFSEIQKLKSYPRCVAHITRCWIQ